MGHNTCCYFALAFDWLVGEGTVPSFLFLSVGLLTLAIPWPLGIPNTDPKQA